MCSQVRGVVQNFIWGGKATSARAKVKWDMLSFPISKGGLGIIDPKTQSEALLAKLLVRGLAPRGEPWKELVKHRVDQTKLLVHGKGPSTPDINWIFVAPKFKRLPCSIWKNILSAWINMRPSLTKSDLTNAVEIFRQPLNHQLKRHTTRNQRLERRLRLYMLRLHKYQGFMEPK